MKKKPSKHDGKAKNKQGLTGMQARFVHEFLIDGVATNAAKRAGYSAKSAETLGYQLLQLPPVREAIQKHQKALFDRIDLTSERILLELYRIAFVDLADAYDQSGALKPMHQIPESIRRAIAGVEVFEEREVVDGRSVKIGETTKLKLVDKRGALELLMKKFKMLTEKVEITGKVTLADLVAGSNEGEKE